MTSEAVQKQHFISVTFYFIFISDACACKLVVTENCQQCVLLYLL